MPVYTDNLARNPRIRTPNDGIARDPMPYSWPFAPPTASYTRNSVAYDWNGNQYAANVPRYLPNKYGNTYYAEEGTTNLLKDASFDSATAIGASGGAWTAYNGTSGGSSVAKDTSTHFGASTTSVKITIPANSTEVENGAGQTISVSAGTTYAFSGYYFGAANDPNWVSIYVIWLNSSGGEVGYSDFSHVNPTNSWTYYTQTATAPTGAVTAQVHFRYFNNNSNASTITAWWDDVQVEVKPYATTVIYAADDTTQATRSPDQLNYTLPQPLPTVWGGMLWWKPSQAYNTGKPQQLLAIGTTGTYSGRYSLAWDGTSTFYWAKSANGTNWTFLHSAAMTFNAGDTIFVGLEDDPVSGTVSLWIGINGGALALTTLANTAQLTGAQVAYIAANASPGNEADGTLGDVQIYGGRNWVSQIPLIYASGSPAPWLPDSIDIRPLNGTFAGVSNPATSGIQIG